MSEESDPKQKQDPKPSGATQESRPEPCAPSGSQPKLPEGEDGHWDRPDD